METKVMNHSRRVPRGLCLRTTLVATLFWLAPPLVASDGHHHHHHQHAAHTHGSATLNVVIEESTLTMVLESPAMNIVGFERTPRNEAEWKKVAAAADILERGADLMQINPQAGCNLQQARVNLPWQADGAVVSEAEHSEISAEYRFTCNHIERLRSLELTLFTHFKSTEEVVVQLVSAKGQRVFHLKPKRRQFRF
jgi:hypothetical protein